MSYINWGTWTWSGPTYGNYGGANYTNGQVGGQGYDLQPVDALNALFMVHDRAYEDAAKLPAGSEEQTAAYLAADQTLIAGISDLKQSSDWQTMSSAGRSYADAAEAAFIAKDGATIGMQQTAIAEIDNAQAQVDLWHGVGDAASSAWNTVTDATTSALQTGVSDVREFASSVANGISSVIDTVGNAAQSALQTGVEAVQQIAGDVVNGLSSLVSGVENAAYHRTFLPRERRSAGLQPDFRGRRYDPERRTIRSADGHQLCSVAGIRCSAGCQRRGRHCRKRRVFGRLVYQEHLFRRTISGQWNESRELGGSEHQRAVRHERLAG